MGVDDYSSHKHYFIQQRLKYKYYLLKTLQQASSELKRHLWYLLLSFHRADHFELTPPHTQVRGDIRSQGEGAADEAAEGNSAAPPAITGA